VRVMQFLLISPTMLTYASISFTLLFTSFKIGKLRMSENYSAGEQAILELLEQIHEAVLLSHRRTDDLERRMEGLLRADAAESGKASGSGRSAPYRYDPGEQRLGKTLQEKIRGFCAGTMSHNDVGGVTWDDLVIAGAHQDDINYCGQAFEVLRIGPSHASTFFAKGNAGKLYGSSTAKGAAKMAYLG